MYQRILVATGGSPWSHAAVTYATQLAAHTGAELRIVTVLTVPTATAAPDTMGGSDVVIDVIERDGQALLAQTATQAQRAGVAYQTFCSWGNIPQTILSLATQAQCDLIVVGSRGLSGLKRLMLGSVGNAVTAKAAQPVLVVKPPTAPGIGFGGRLLVATGGSPWSDAAVAHAVQLARSQHLELCVLHVDRGPSRRGEDPAASEGKELLTKAEVQAAMAGIAYEGVLASGPIAATILETAQAKKCDVIIVGSRGLTGWKRLMVGSIANEVTAKATMPVLIVKRFFDTSAG